MQNKPISPDFHALFESVPGLYLVLTPDLSIIAVSNAYLSATMTKREDIMGKGLFEVFPDNPDDPAATGVNNLRASLNRVLKNKTADAMAVQKYDIRRPDSEGGGFEERFWSPVNSPVLGENKNVLYIIHRVEDVTEYIRMKKQEDEKQKLTEELKSKAEKMESEIFLRARQLQESNKNLRETELKLAALNRDLELKVEERTREILSKEKSFRDTLDKMLEGMQIIGYDWRYLYVNDAVAKQGKYSKEELLGYTMMEKYPGIDQTEVFGVFKKCMQERVSHHLENEFLYPDGSKGWFELSIQPVPEGIFILSVDISERRNAEENLRKSEEFYRALITDAADAVHIVSLDGFIKYEGLGATKILGYLPEEMIGKHVAELMHPDEIEWANGLIAKGEKITVEQRIKHKNGHWVWVESTATFLLDNPAIKGLVVNYRDITERRKAQEEIAGLNQGLEIKVQERTAQLASVNKELESFSYSVSHDLRAPLRAVDGYTRILEEEYGNKLDEEGKRLLEVIQYNAQKMGVLIDDLLTFSRLGKKELQKSRINMNELAEGTLREMNKNVPHKAEIIVGDLHPARTDYGLMSQVLYNLISNAVKYSSKTSGPRIEIKSEQQNGSIIYSVKDNGAGFDMQYAHKLFSVFQRLHTPEEFEGTGVGLAIVQRIISKHGGNVWAEAKKNKGATFYFSIPNE